MYRGVGLLGSKAGMSTWWRGYEEGKTTAMPVTIIGFESDNYVTQKLREEEHGYNAIQVRLVSLQAAVTLHVCNMSHQAHQMTACTTLSQLRGERFALCDRCGCSCRKPHTW